MSQTGIPTKPPALPKPWVLSQEKGYADTPRDMDWVQKNIPCQTACPSGTDIPEYLAAIARGEYELAYRINLRDNVFPAVLGRVCSRPCEDHCRHGWEGLGESVAICFAKRSAETFATGAPVVLEPLFESSGKTVAVIGSGVAGLAVARDLALFGHAPTVFEKHERPGGMLNQGIPEFRLPRDIIEREIEQVRRAGVDIVCGTAVGPDLPLAKLLDDYDAVVMAAGTLRPNMLDLPGQELSGIRHGLDFLLDVNEAGSRDVGRKVVVIGGGFTAMDCARTSWRLDTDDVRVLYRRGPEEMLITPGELDELDHEGISMEFMAAPLRYKNGSGNGLTAAMFIRTELGDPDASGRPRPVPISGSEFDVDADEVLLATGQFPDTDWIDAEYRQTLVNDDGWLASASEFVTGLEGLFVAGDFATGATTLIDAIGHARLCARAVDTFLTGDERLHDVIHIEDAVEIGRTREMDFIERQEMPTIPVEERSLTAEVETGYGDESAKTESTRCYLCNFKYEIDNDICIYCDGCLRVKPVEDCIVKVDKLLYDENGLITGYKRSESAIDYNMLYIDQNECIRCGACADVCPVDCIPLQKVSKTTITSSEFN